MFDLQKEKDIKEFKRRLKSIRIDETQAQFAKRIFDLNDRGRIANWESLSSTTIPTLADFALLCDKTNTNANYLLGVEEINRNDDYIIAQELNLSTNTVKKFRNKAKINSFIDFVINTPEIEDIMDQIESICTHNWISEASYTLFDAESVKICDKVFRLMLNEMNVMEIDLNIYLHKLEFAFKRAEEKNTENSMDIKLLQINQNEKNSFILPNYPNFDELDDNAKKSILLKELGELRFAYLLKSELAIIAKEKITRNFSFICDKYIESKSIQNKEN